MFRELTGDTCFFIPQHKITIQTKKLRSMVQNVQIGAGKITFTHTQIVNCINEICFAGAVQTIDKAEFVLKTDGNLAVVLVLEDVNTC